MKTRTILAWICLLVFGVTQSMAQNNKLYIPDVYGMPGSEVDLPVCLDNTSDVTALQFALSLPEGTTLDASSVEANCDRVGDHLVIIRSPYSDNNYIFMVYSPTNQLFEGNSGVLFTVKLKIPETYVNGTEYKLSMSEATLSDVYGHNVLTEYEYGLLKVMDAEDVQTLKVEISSSDNIAAWNDLSATHNLTVTGVYESTVGTSAVVDYAVEDSVEWTALTDTLESGESFTASLRAKFLSSATVHAIHFRTRTLTGDTTMQQSIEIPDVRNHPVTGIESKTYTGCPLYQTNLSCSLESGQYVVTNYSNNVNAGTATFEVNGVFPYAIGKSTYSFSIYQFDEAEWAILQDFYATSNGASWVEPWDMTEGITSVSRLNGLTIDRGHVTGIDLSFMGLCGEFPYQLLELPHLSFLNLSSNSLYGNISEGLAMYLAMSGRSTVGAAESLCDLDISQNSLEGNIGAFAEMFPKLYYLTIYNNSISEVVPMLSAGMQVKLYPQYINDRGNNEWGEPYDTYYWGEITEEMLLDKLPTIVTYNHDYQTYEVPSLLYCQDEATSGGQWSADFCLEEGKPKWSTTAAYNVPNGERMYCQDWNTGTGFYMSFVYEEGDADFSGAVDVLDLQSSINYMFEEYQGLSFNFMAANLWADELINVQDAVCLVNILLEKEEYSNTVYTARSVSMQEATVYMQDGQLMFNSSVPVAAFDVVLEGKSELNLLPALSAYGFTCTTKQCEDGWHLVGYSLSGTTLPTGETAICQLADGKVAQVMLSDKSAHEVRSTILHGLATGVQRLADDFRWSVNGSLLCIGLPSDVQTLAWQIYTIDGRLLEMRQIQEVRNEVEILLPESVGQTYIVKLVANGTKEITKRILMK